MIILTESIRQTLDEGSFGCSIIIHNVDLRKAFDTTDHKIQLHNTEYLYYGVCNVCNDWFKSNLSEHYKQCVSINGYTSNLTPINCGVPQGSTLGQSLFIHLFQFIFPSKLKVQNL